MDDDNSDLTVDFGFTPLVSLGNRVWNDNGAGLLGMADDGEHNGDEPGINGVELRLLMADGVTPATDADGNPVTAVTDADGYYLFDRLLPGEYIVEILSTNFSTGNLAEMISSRPTEDDPDDDNDRDDNGIDDNDPASNGIRSGIVTLSVNAEPTETDLDPNPTIPADAPSAHGSVNDNNSNLTVDFGFIEVVSLGNRVWFDSNSNGIDNSEPPVVGAIVNLYRDVDNDGSAEPNVDVNRDGDTFDGGETGDDGAPIATTTTDANGNYLFDNLAPGNYFVEIAADNFQSGFVLDNYTSTEPSVDDPESPETNLDDNGRIVSTDLRIYGVRSGVVELVAGTEPQNDAVGAEIHGDLVSDPSSNLTVDFGFVPSVSLGNRVWFDLNDNGVQDAGESGVSDVTLNLLAGTGNTVLGTTVTDANGYYLFDNLVPGEYRVSVISGNF